jgi:hypothetical protein
MIGNFIIHKISLNMRKLVGTLVFIIIIIKTPTT